MTDMLNQAPYPGPAPVSGHAPDLESVARDLLRARLLDDLEEAELAPRGEVAYQFSARGHELPQVLLARTLTHPHDAATVYYRSRPFVMAAGLSPAEALAGGMARSGSPSEGRDVGVMFSMPPRGGPTILPASGDVGAQFTPAAGWAQAIRYHVEVLDQADWAGAVAVAFGGDGSVATNGFWAALVMASTQNLPLLIVIEDNGYGLSVPAHFHTPGGDIARNLASFDGLKVLAGSGTRLPETADLVHEAVTHVRSGQGPCLLRVQVPRLCGHTFIDNQAYKDAAEIEAEQARDPLLELARHLGQDRLNAIRAELDEEVRNALAQARANPWPDTAEVTRHLFFDGVSPEVGGRGTHLEGDSARARAATRSPAGAGPLSGRGRRINLVDAVRQVLAEELERNPRLVVFGEDVGVKGGVHGATIGLQRRFGKDRVFDTSLSEEGIIGRAVGMALAGLRPVPEIQFRKYADPATEQINDCGTLRWRTAGRFAAPMVVRIPVGYGKKVGDPWHSVTGEAVYAHTLGWRIAFPSNAADAAGLLRTALAGDDPTLFLEHRALLDAPIARRPDPGPDHAIPFGVAKVIRPGTHLTLVTWGAMVYPSLEAAERFDRRVEVLDLRTISPWDRTTVLESVRKTSRCLVVHEDTRTAGFGAEILATLADDLFEYLDAPLRRLAVPDCPIPYNRVLMTAVIPGADRIGEEIARTLAY